ncbi:MAG TPA: cytochrome d ubiquinol oxidase subunit II [Chromatiaceae bacterium]|nr:cytochrome d ubiquinol oxidase subunit II [Chromatiaceae bacterium]
MFDYETMKLIWWALVGVLLIGFVVMDGMDLGVGTLLPFMSKDDVERRVVINTVGPHWDGNQVWFITAAGALFAAWPAVYAAAFSGFYFAMMLVLFALFFRPVGFDYRSKLENPKWRNFWDWGLFIGSMLPGLVFGIAFGNLLQGVPFHYDDFLRPYYTGSFLGLFNPFALLSGVVSLGMLTLHGAIYLQLRTTDVLNARARRFVRLATLVTLASFALAGLWVAFGMDGYRIVSQPEPGALPNPLAKTVEIASGAWMQNYRSQPLTMIAPIAGFLGPLLTWLFSRLGRPGLGFISSAIGMAGIITTAAVSMFPFVMPSSSNPNASLTLWDAASSHMTLSIMFVAAAIFVPLIILYTSWCFYKMRGKVTVEAIRENSHSAY